ncbi:MULTISPECIES: hypothetical protein [unclassified Streptomyces]|uniref:hypothetical protein n=1 Tax=unclassified Streptomyces TaxID=2593676 RepID=UPI00371DA777
MTEHDDATEYGGALERAKRYEAMAARYGKKAMAGEAGAAGAAQLAQTFASLAVAARMERMDWRMRVLGDQLGDVEKAMNLLRRKLPER